MSSSFNLISHPDKTLEEHLNNCNVISKKLLEMKFISANFFPISQLEEWRKLIVFFHDLGKATDFFQNKIIKASLSAENNESFIAENRTYIDYFLYEKQNKVEQEFGKIESLDSHAKIGAYLQLQNCESDNSIVRSVLVNVINRHHGDLPNWEPQGKNPFFLADDDMEKLEKQIEFLNLDSFKEILKPHGLSIQKENWKETVKLYQKRLNISKTRKELKKANSYQYFFLQHFLFSLLLSADKGDVMLSKKNVIVPNIRFDENLIDNYKQFNFSTLKQKEIDKEREKAYREIANNIKKYSAKNFFSITLPTGLGKTFSAYNAAILLQNEIKEYNPRIIYCLPFTSIIDQNSSIFNEIATFGNIPHWHIAKHHYLSDYNENYSGENISFSESEYLTEGWEQDFIITTFVQLLESIFTNKNRALRKFHNIANSIIILDEVQNIPPKYYQVIEEVFAKMADYFNTKFIFVTATQPVVFAEKEIIELTDPEKERTKVYFKNRDRIRLEQRLLRENNYQPQKMENLIEIFQNDIENNPEKSFLFICNTIAQSQFVYNELKKQNSETRKFVYLSGSILPYRRKQLIKLIQRRIKNDIPQIIVSTQVVEAGVDIDLDIVYRDFAPLDSINQSAGRCNRNGIKGKGIVNLYNSGKSQIYDSVLMQITENIFKGYKNIIDEKEFYNLNQEFFQKVQKSITFLSDESDILKKAIKNLQLQTVKDNFKLINELNYYYNVFIPYHKKANEVWNEYLDCLEIENKFERKQEIKKIKPKLLQFVTRFPKNRYEPNEKNKDDFIIYEENWQSYYDLITGFNVQKDDTIFIV